MKKNSTIWGVLGGIFFVTILYMLVRPSSKAATAIVTLTDALESIISLAVNGTAGTGK